MADMKHTAQQTSQKNNKQPPMQTMQGKNRGQSTPAVSSEKEHSKHYAKVSGSKR